MIGPEEFYSELDEFEKKLFVDPDAAEQYLNSRLFNPVDEEIDSLLKIFTVKTNLENYKTTSKNDFLTLLKASESSTLKEIKGFANIIIADWHIHYSFGVNEAKRYLSIAEGLLKGTELAERVPRMSGYIDALSGFTDKVITDCKQHIDKDNTNLYWFILHGYALFLHGYYHNNSFFKEAYCVLDKIDKRITDQTTLTDHIRFYKALVLYYENKWEQVISVLDSVSNSTYYKVRLFGPLLRASSLHRNNSKPAAKEIFAEWFNSYGFNLGIKRRFHKNPYINTLLWDTYFLFSDNKHETLISIDKSARKFAESRKKELLLSKNNTVARIALSAPYNTASRYLAYNLKRSAGVHKSDLYDPVHLFSRIDSNITASFSLLPQIENEKNPAQKLFEMSNNELFLDTAFLVLPDCDSIYSLQPMLLFRGKFYCADCEKPESIVRKLNPKQLVVTAGREEYRQSERLLKILKRECPNCCVYFSSGLRSLLKKVLHENAVKTDQIKTTILAANYPIKERNFGIENELLELCGDNSFLVYPKNINDVVTNVNDSSVIIFLAHSCAGDNSELYGNRIDFGSFALSLSDLYANFDTLYGKRFFIGSCKAAQTIYGKKAAGALSLGAFTIPGVLSSLGAGEVWAPFGSPRVRSLPEIIRIFMNRQRLFSKALPDGWAVFV